MVFVFSYYTVDISMATDHFYSNLEAHHKSFEKILADRKNFSSIPHDWHVIVTDIVNSTFAFAKGKYKELNIVGSSTIATVLNIAQRHGIEVPFVYGGDGSTVVVPPSILDEALRALVAVQQSALKDFDMTLRVGAVPMHTIRDHGYDIRVAKFHVVNGYPQAIFIDSGLYHAEKLVKSDKFLTRKRAHKIPFQFDGLTCRWDVVPPPPGYSEVLCLIVMVNDFKHHQSLYRKILSKITVIYGNFANRHPINIDVVMQNMRLKSLVRESYQKYGKLDSLYVVTRALIALWEGLRKQVVGKGSSYDFFMTATDTLKMDGKLCTIIAGNPEQRELLIDYLTSEEAAGTITFGYAVTPSTTITCLIREEEDDYINFIDGTDGGYVKAATMMKLKTGTSLED